MLIERIPKRYSSNETMLAEIVRSFKPWAPSELFLKIIEFVRLSFSMTKSNTMILFYMYFWNSLNKNHEAQNSS
jgi:hypothetical protein